ncbi:4Fe-4S dicluster domain-containing protein [Anaerocolumna sedimenticola]|uniref:Ion-translocating oxidoreductase complex subunit B n=1 Tax=Anaerocolumna sedimenticola TaxID=2696063 RepID=A0A6P1TIB3_9FIRM|nr:RnfABCDGE type electron transport complex subunit B [Anaerocolumna sedimenticola]QHQ60037.1 4Fe-4S dicluster domain-containing protein [Anaerocolumna sedimenticola]
MNITIINGILLNSFPVLALNLTGVGIATLLISATGIIIGLFLGLAAKKLEVEVDEKEQLVRELLPGNNCGACGFAGCDNLAQAIASGNAAANACPVANSKVHSQIAEVMGTNVEETERQVAFVKCAGTCDKTKVKYNYYGIQDCKKAAFTPGKGPKQCGYGCTGFGSCVKVCQFDAIHVVDGVAIVDKEKCTACGLCIKECPNNLIELVPYNTGHFVRCNSKDKGKDVKAGCSIGCIGCMMCVKACEFDAVKVENNLARIDYSKCTNCGKCAEKCPTKVILSELK